MALFAFSITSDARAEVWTYTSPAFSSGDYITAAVDVSCTGACSPGTYSYGSGITSITLSGYASDNTLIESLSLPGGTSWGYTDYLNIASNGTISDFFFIIYAAPSVYASEILIDGYATAAGSNVAGQIFVAGPGYVNGDYGFPTYLSGPIVFRGDGAPPPSIYDYPPASPGPTAVPEPSTWAMMLIGFAGIGFSFYRRTATRALLTA